MSKTFKMHEWKTGKCGYLIDQPTIKWTINRNYNICKCRILRYVIGQVLVLYVQCDKK